jgi:hypothetical protein
MGQIAPLAPPLLGGTGQKVILQSVVVYDMLTDSKSNTFLLCWDVVQSRQEGFLKRSGVYQQGGGTRRLVAQEGINDRTNRKSQKTVLQLH